MLQAVLSHKISPNFLFGILLADIYFFYRADQKTWYCLDCLTGMTVDISSCIGFPVYDEIHDLPSSAPSYGIAGWSEDGTRVGIYDRYDIWVIDLNNPQKIFTNPRVWSEEQKNHPFM